MPHIYLPIDKNVPLPPRRQCGMKPGAKQSRPKVQWSKMCVGDSVLLEGATVDRARVAISVPRNLYGYGFNIRVEFCKKTGAEIGARIWRAR